MLSLVAANPPGSFAPVSYIGFFGSAFFANAEKKEEISPPLTFRRYKSAAA